MSSLSHIVLQLYCCKDVFCTCRRLNVANFPLRVDALCCDELNHYRDVLAKHHLSIAGLHCRREWWRRARVTLLIAQCSGLWSRPICCRLSEGRHFYRTRVIRNLWEQPNSLLYGCLPAGMEKAQLFIVNILPDCFIVGSEKTVFRQGLSQTDITNPLHQ